MDIALQILSLFGGLGMFLFGMNTMSTGLERAAGDKLRQIMEKVTGNLFKSVILGAVVAALTQSSSATTVMVVGFVNAGILTLSQAVGIIMGANIGTTITAWILSLNDLPGDVWYYFRSRASFLLPKEKHKNYRRIFSWSRSYIYWYGIHVKFYGSSI